MKLVDLDSIFIEGLPSYKLTVGEKYALSVEAFPTGDYTENVIWSLNFDTIVHKDDVATLDSNGNLTLKSVGLTTIVVKSKLNDDIWDAVTVEVFPAPIGIEITNMPSDKSLCVGTIYQFDSLITPSNAIKDVIWSSDNDKVEILDKDNGIFKFIDVGVVDITVTAVNNKNIRHTYSLNITEINMTNIPSNQKLYVGDTHQLGISFTSNSSTNLEWLSSDKDVATIDSSGSLIAYLEGKTTIALFNNGVKVDEFELEVLSYTNSVTTQETVFGPVLSDVPTVQAYLVHVRLSYEISGVCEDKALIKKIKVYASYPKGALQDGLNLPHLEVGNTELNGESLEMVTNDETSFYDPTTVYDSEVVVLNKWVDFGSEITSLATMMLSGAIFNYRDVEITTTIQRRG